MDTYVKELFSLYGWLVRCEEVLVHAAILHRLWKDSGDDAVFTSMHGVLSDAGFCAKIALEEHMVHTPQELLGETHRVASEVRRWYRVNAYEPDDIGQDEIHTQAHAMDRVCRRIRRYVEGL